MLILRRKLNKAMANLSDKQKKYLKYFWIIFLSPIILFVLIIFLISMGWVGFMPTFEDLENPNRNLASEIYSDDGKVLSTYYLDENRNAVEYKDISPLVIQALIAREDHRFRKHSGIDGWGLLRVMSKTILLGNESQGGGSTLTQQLAKNLYTRQSQYNRDSIVYKFGLFKKIALTITKFKEWVIAVKLERNYSKEEIITMYLNTVPFGGEDYGIKIAARTYYNKSPDSLKIEEAAMLVGMLKATTKYNPKRNPERALIRRNSVLDKMYEHDYISKAQYDSVSQIPIEKSLNYQSQAQDAGLAPYLREYIRILMTRKKPERNDYNVYKTYQEDSLRWMEDPIYGWCYKNLKPDGTPYNLYKDGLKIRTTINSRMQGYAEKSLVEHLAKTIQPAFYLEKKGKSKAPYANDRTESEIQKWMFNAMHQTPRFKNLRNTGLTDSEILKNFKTKTEMRVFSYKGERDTIMSPWDSIKYYKFFLRASFLAVDPHTGYIKAWVGGPDFRYFKYNGVMQKRQVGSTIKPFLYTLAMQEGMKPCDKILNARVTIEQPELNTEWSPQNSGETKWDGKEVTMKFAIANSLNNVSARLMKQYKPQPMIDIIRKMGVKSEIPAVPSICLGTPELTLYELIGAYTTFANKGVYTQPIFIAQIEDKNGNLLTTIKPQQNEAISEYTAYTMVKMLQQVVLGGTGARLRYRFNLMHEMGGKTGTTDNHSDGWFVGVTPDLVAGAWVGGEEPTIHFDRMKSGEGAALALPIFGLFMQKVYADPKINLNTGPFQGPEGFNVNFDCSMGDVDESISKENLEDNF